MSLTNMNDFKDKLYSEFRVANIANRKIKDVNKDVDIFRRILYLSVLTAIGEHKPDIQEKQMIAAYVVRTLKDLEIGLYLPEAYLMTGSLDCAMKKYGKNTITYAPIYSLLNYFIRSNNTKEICYLLPLFITYPVKDVKWIRYEIVSLETALHRIISRKQIDQNTMLDIFADFGNFIGIIKPVIHSLFRNPKISSEFLMPRVMLAMREVSLIWACNVFKRSKFEEDPEFTNICDKTITDRVLSYRKINISADLEFKE